MGTGIAVMLSMLTKLFLQLSFTAEIVIVFASVSMVIAAFLHLFFIGACTVFTTVAAAVDCRSL
jgi:hypothetical protein